MYWGTNNWTNGEINKTCNTCVVQIWSIQQITNVYCMSRGKESMTTPTTSYKHILYDSLKIIHVVAHAHTHTPGILCVFGSECSLPDELCRQLSCHSESVFQQSEVTSFALALDMAHPTLSDANPYSWGYYGNLLRNWVDEFIHSTQGTNKNLDPSTFAKTCDPTLQPPKQSINEKTIQQWILSFSSFENSRAVFKNCCVFSICTGGLVDFQVIQKYKTVTSQYRNENRIPPGPSKGCQMVPLQGVNWSSLMVPLEGGGTITRIIYHVASIYGAFTYIQHKNQSNVGKYTTHGSYRYDFLWTFFTFLIYHPINKESTAFAALSLRPEPLRIGTLFLVGHVFFFRTMMVSFEITATSLLNPAWKHFGTQR